MALTLETAIMTDYEKFQDWCHAQGLSFPCNAAEFYSRAAAFAAGDDALIEDLCEQGIGPDWRE